MLKIFLGNLNKSLLSLYENCEAKLLTITITKQNNCALILIQNRMMEVRGLCALSATSGSGHVWASTTTCASTRMRNRSHAQTVDSCSPRKAISRDTCLLMVILKCSGKESWIVFPLLFTYRQNTWNDVWCLDKCGKACYVKHCMCA